MIIKTRLTLQQFANLGAFLISDVNLSYKYLIEGVCARMNFPLDEITVVLSSKTEGIRHQDVTLEVRGIWVVDSVSDDASRLKNILAHPRIREAIGGLELLIPGEYLLKLHAAIGAEFAVSES